MEGLFLVKPNKKYQESFENWIIRYLKVWHNMDKMDMF